MYVAHLAAALHDGVCLSIRRLHLREYIVELSQAQLCPPRTRTHTAEEERQPAEVRGALDTELQRWDAIMA